MAQTTAPITSENGPVEWVHFVALPFATREYKRV